MSHPKFVQIAVAKNEDSTHLVALDEEGGVWRYHGDGWKRLSDKTIVEQ